MANFSTSVSLRYTDAGDSLSKQLHNIRLIQANEPTVFDSHGVKYLEDPGAQTIRTKRFYSMLQGSAVEGADLIPPSGAQAVIGYILNSCLHIWFYICCFKIRRCRDQAQPYPLQFNIYHTGKGKLVPP